jgi:hypothetical protein
MAVLAVARQKTASTIPISTLIHETLCFCFRRPRRHPVARRGLPRRRPRLLQNRHHRHEAGLLRILQDQGRGKIGQRRQKRKEAEELSSEAKSLEREMAEFRQRREQQLQEQVTRVRKGILDEIKVLVEKKAKDANYDLVFDKSGMGVNGVPFLLFSKDAVDFSQEIVTELNKDAPKETAKPAAAAPADKKAK